MQRQRQVKGEDGFNSCDKCGAVMPSSLLIWVNDPDFKPLDGEELTADAKTLYDALCASCYASSLVKFHANGEPARQRPPPLEMSLLDPGIAERLDAGILK